MTKVGMLYICTGKYTVFWPEFYRTFNEKFLPNCEKEYFVFTDASTIEYEDPPAPASRRACGRKLRSCHPCTPPARPEPDQ